MGVVGCGSEGVEFGEEARGLDWAGEEVQGGVGGGEGFGGVAEGG